MTLELLGYKMAANKNLYGGFPDIPNQLLEVRFKMHKQLI
jgi:hypothetical protein